jgi:hypothetical protein
MQLTWGTLTSSSSSSLRFNNLDSSSNNKFVFDRRNTTTGGVFLFYACTSMKTDEILTTGTVLLLLLLTMGGARIHEKLGARTRIYNNRVGSCSDVSLSCDVCPGLTVQQFAARSYNFLKITQLSISGVKTECSVLVLEKNTFS